MSVRSVTTSHTTLYAEMNFERLGLFRQIAMIRFQGGKPQFVSEADVPKKEARRESLRQAQRGLEYIESEIYFLFKKQP
jgi:hypothetical protein